MIPTYSDSLCIFSDASTTGIGGTLCVYRDSQWQPCSFYSRQLFPRERNYAILDLEALALLATVRHFHYYLSGVYFKAFTDHKPLINILDGQPPSARLLRWKIKLADYHFDFIHIAGEVNSVADALSRQSCSSLKKMAPLFYQRLIPYYLADIQQYPPELLKYFKSCFTISINGGKSML